MFIFHEQHSSPIQQERLSYMEQIFNPENNLCMHHRIRGDSKLKTWVIYNIWHYTYIYMVTGEKPPDKSPPVKS